MVVLDNSNGGTAALVTKRAGPELSRIAKRRGTPSPLGERGRGMGAQKTALAYVQRSVTYAYL